MRQALAGEAVYDIATTPEHARPNVKFQVANSFNRTWRDISATRQGPNPSFQFIQFKRLYQIVIRVPASNPNTIGCICPGC